VRYSTREPGVYHPSPSTQFPVSSRVMLPYCSPSVTTSNGTQRVESEVTVRAPVTSAWSTRVIGVDDTGTTGTFPPELSETVGGSGEWPNIPVLSIVKGVPYSYPDAPELWIVHSVPETLSSTSRASWT